MSIETRKNIRKILVLVSLCILITLVMALSHDKLEDFDKVIYDIIISFKSPIMTNIFKMITFFASVTWFLVLIVLLFIFNKDKSINITIFIYLVGIVFITLLLKNTFVRERPFDLMLIEENGYSFPSGHSSISMAFYGFVSYLIYKSNYSKKKKGILIFCLLFLAFLIGVSRIYLGVHYPSDVLAGFMLGIIYFIIFTWIYKINIRRSKK